MYVYVIYAHMCFAIGIIEEYVYGLYYNIIFYECPTESASNKLSRQYAATRVCVCT